MALRSVTEHIDTTSPVGRFNFRNLASAAELETDLTSQRVKMGMHGLAKNGKWPNGRPPLGYDKADDATLAINEQEQRLVRRIFKLYLLERSMPQVAYLLNESGIKTKNGESWCRQSIKNVLSNEIYVGKYKVAEYENHIEQYRLLEDELFEAVTDTRYRFRHSNSPMNGDRKESKAERIFKDYQQHIGHK